MAGESETAGPGGPGPNDLDTLRNILLGQQAQAADSRFKALETRDQEIEGRIEATDASLREALSEGLTEARAALAQLRLDLNGAQDALRADHEKHATEVDKRAAALIARIDTVQSASEAADRENAESLVRLHERFDDADAHFAERLDALDARITALETGLKALDGRTADLARQLEDRADALAKQLEAQAQAGAAALLAQRRADRAELSGLMGEMAETLSRLAGRLGSE